MPKKFFFFVLLSGFLILVSSGLIFLGLNGKIKEKFSTPKQLAQQYTPFLSPSPSPTPTPTPKPLTFAEMNALYGPCVHLPVLLYHHIQDKETAKESKQTALTVETEFFQKQMSYLKEHGYNVLPLSTLVNFFENGTSIPKKSVALTFDDGYEDFYTNALPVLRQYGFASTLFVPTGLMNNPGYLSWNQISEAASSGVYIANHTWSHKNVMMTKDKDRYEIETAHNQLAEKGFNTLNIFAYPYGLESENGKSILTQLNYKLAFSTKSGSTQCQKQKFDLPRIRIGNADLSAYGF